MNTRRSRRLAKFNNDDDIVVTSNRLGRPIRAILSTGLTSKVFGTIDTKGVHNTIKQKMMDDKGWSFAVDNNSVANRTRISLDYKELEYIIGRYFSHTEHASTIYGIERRIQDMILKSHLDGGVLYTDPDKCNVFNRGYSKIDYRIMFAGVFWDPVGTRVQNVHEDIHADRDPIWNIVLPIQMDQQAIIAESEFCQGMCARRKLMSMSEATMWDAG